MQLPAGASTPRAGAAPSDGDRGASLRILLAEDDETSLIACRRLLEKCGRLFWRMTMAIPGIFSPGRDAPFRSIVAALLVLLLAGLAGGVWLFATQERRLKQQAEDDLAAIAASKIAQIENWRHERLGDAATVSESPFFLQSAQRFLQDSGPKDRDNLLQLFARLEKNYQYSDLALIGPDKAIRLRLGQAAGLSPSLAQTLDLARAEGRPIFTDVHPNAEDGILHLDVVAPLFAGGGPSGAFLGWLALQTSAAQFLFPLLQTWPTHSRTAETLLVRRDGDDVVFLNDLRRRPGAALALRIPLTATDVLAVQAALGVRGLAHGLDYRGEAVLGVVQPVPDTPWLLISKMDSDEVYAAWREQALYILALMGCLLGGGVFVALLLRQYGLKAHYQALYEAEAKLRDALEQQAATLRGIGDAVIVVDVQGRTTLVNAAAERLTGWNATDALGRPLEDVFRIMHEQTREPLEHPLAQAPADGAAGSLAAPTLLVARDGSERPIASSAAPIRDGRGELVGMVLIFRDNSAERRLLAANDARSSSEAKYRELVENAQSIILKVDTEGRITFFNEYAQQFFGYAEAEILGRPAAGTIAPGDDAAQRDITGVSQEILFRPDAHGLMENENLRRDNTRVWVRWANKTIRDAAGNIVGVLAVGTDITDRKRAESALRKSEAFSRAIIASSPDCIKVLNSQGELVFMNQGGMRLLELSDFTQVAGRPYLDFWQGSDFERARAAYEEARQGRPGRFDGYCPTQGGTPKWWDVSISPAPGPDGEPDCFLVISRDDTQRKLAVDALRESEERFRQLVESAPDAIYVQVEGRFVYVNRACLELYGLDSPEAMLGTSVLERFHPDYHARVLERIRAIRETQQAQPLMEQRHLRADGSFLDVEVSAVPLCYGGRNGAMVFVRNIAERKRLETLREDMDRIARHDLKTPLNAILGLPQVMLMDDNLTDEQREFLRCIMDSGYKMLGLVNLSLDLFRMERGTYELAPANVDLLRVVGKVLGDLEQMRAPKKLAARLALDGRPPGPQDVCPARAEELLCYSMFSNLIKNAQEAAPPGGTVTINCVRDQDGWRIDIRNPGETPAELRDRFFEKYATMGKVGGTGLGTYSAQLMAATMGGKISLDASEAGGTTVSVWLPAMN